MAIAYIQHYFVDGKPLGYSKRELKQVHEKLQAPESYAYFCPVCAEVWARCPVTADGVLQRFQVWTLTCKCHANPKMLQIPGSLFLAWDKPFNDALSDEVISREFQIHMDTLC